MPEDLASSDSPEGGCRWRHGIGIMAVVACLALAPRPCPAAETAETAEWRREIEADWLRQLARAGDAHRGSGITPEADAAGACDGVRDEETGFHTERQQDPWWQVDLGAPAPLTRIVVYNARDCRERAAGLRVLLSEDAETWREVYRHDERVFGGSKDGDPLVIRLAGERARFVRAALSGTEYLHLNEVEVFGSGAPGRNLALGKAATQSSVSQWSTVPANWQPELPPELVRTEISKALERGTRLCADLRGTAHAPDLDAAAATLGRLRAEAESLDAAPAEAARALYLEVRRAVRELALKNPLVAPSRSCS